VFGGLSRGGRVRLALLAVVPLAGAAAIRPPAAAAATFTVTTIANTGPGSLRAAILAANATAALDTIAFAIPPAGQHTITLTTALPAITQPVVVNGRTQPGWTTSPVIRLDNGIGNPGAVGLDVTAGGSQIVALDITDFGIGVRLRSGGRNTVLGCFVGVDFNGHPAGNGTGIAIQGGSAANVIGGTTSPTVHDVFGANTTGVAISGPGTTGNRVRGNAFGPAAGLGNTAGVSISGAATGNTVGGTSPALRNVFSFNGDGIDISGGGTTGNAVEGNFIGTDVTGKVAAGNGTGVVISTTASGNTVGGPDQADRNVVSGNTTNGVELGGAKTKANVVEGNGIGEDVSATKTIANGNDGVLVHGGAAGNTVASNAIVGNGNDGVELSDAGTSANVVHDNSIGAIGATAMGNKENGVAISGGAGGNTIGPGNLISGNDVSGVLISGANGNVVQGNDIGTDAGGSSALGNEFGVDINAAASGNVVGGTAAGTRNVISGNAFGVDLASGGNVVEGNFIGTDATGTKAVANEFFGVVITNGSGNTIGGSSTAARNVISGNGFDGVAIRAPGNVVAGNFIGTDASGGSALANQRNGVDLAPGATGEVVGGTTAGARNVISGNTTNGVLVEDVDDVVEGNYVGTDAAGTAAIPNDAGVAVVSTGSTIGGTTGAARNVVSGNTTVGVEIDDDGNVVQGNFIGTDASGSSALGNAGVGLDLSTGADGTTVGGTSAGARNVISGNADVGIAIDGTTALVQGNFVGTDKTGKTPIPNAAGIEVSDGPNTIGGTAAGARNLISGNSGFGVDLFTTSANGNVVAGNFVGTDVSGNARLANAGSGVSCDDCSGNTIGGTDAGAGNLISGNAVGVELNGIFAETNTVAGNLIGTNAAGTAAVGNGDGIILDAAKQNTIGGTTAAARNVVAGSAPRDGDGITIRNGATGNVVEGDYVGTNAAGTASLPNLQGIAIAGSSGNRIGGTAAGAGNLVSGNDQTGIAVGASSSNSIVGDLIGTDASGTGDLGNGGDGVGLGSSSSGNTIGGTTATAGNTIAFNAGDGVKLDGVETDANPIERNSIFSDAGLGIELANFANDGQNAPTITSVTTGATNTTVQVSLSSAGTDSIRFEAFVSPTCDPSGAGEGETFLAAKTVAPSGGTAATGISVPKLAPGQAVTATATDVTTRDTSAFSVCATTP